MSHSVATHSSHPRGLGTPLDASDRGTFSAAFGYDFGAVRVHAGAEASAAANLQGAAAYTLGHDVVLGSHYNSGTHDGRRLLAHELAHVVQQQGKGSAVARSGGALNTVEREADAAAERAASGRHVGALTMYADPGVIHRQLFPPAPIVLNPLHNSEPTSIEVSVVDERVDTSMPWYNPARVAGPLANWIWGNATMSDSATMAANVLALLGDRTMTRLNIMDHGNSLGIEIGSDWIATVADVKRFAGSLGRLRGKFSAGGFVHLQNCEAGANKDVMCALADVFGVPVFGGTGSQSALLPINFGSYVSCGPGAVWNPDSGRPSTPPPPPTITSDMA